jgi:hypothetical protein
MKHVEAGNSGKREKKKRGRKPKADPQKFRYMFRFNDAEMERFLSLYKKSGKRSYSAFITDCILNKSLQVIEINKSLIDFTMMLNSFFAQFRAVKNNYNQVFHALIRVFGEQKAWKMMKIVEQSTLQFVLLNREIEEITLRFREKCLPK